MKKLELDHDRAAAFLFCVGGAPICYITGAVLNSSSQKGPVIVLKNILHKKKAVQRTPWKF